MLALQEEALGCRAGLLLPRCATADSVPALVWDEGYDYSGRIGFDRWLGANNHSATTQLPPSYRPCFWTERHYGVCAPFLAFLNFWPFWPFYTQVLRNAVDAGRPEMGHRLLWRMAASDSGQLLLLVGWSRHPEIASNLKKSIMSQPDRHEWRQQRRQK